MSYDYLPDRHPVAQGIWDNFAIVVIALFFAMLVGAIPMLLLIVYLTF